MKPINFLIDKAIAWDLMREPCKSLLTFPTGLILHIFKILFSFFSTDLGYTVPYVQILTGLNKLQTSILGKFFFFIFIKNIFLKYLQKNIGIRWI